MSKYTISDWMNSSGGPFVIMEEAKASLWNGSAGSHSDYDLACQSSDYASKLVLHNSNILVLGDESLQTAIAKSNSRHLIIRWKWADSKESVRAAIEQIDFNTINNIEKLDISWASQSLVLFDAAGRFEPAQCLRFSTHPGVNEISTFIHQPIPRTSLLVHSIV